MQIRGEQLEAQLARSLAAVYAIHGDEPLLALEAADAVRAAARRQGYAEREVFEAQRGFDWSEFAHAGASRSLFGGRKLLELRLPSGKPAAPAAAAIVEYCARPNPEVLLLVTLPRPEGPGWWKSAWFTALDRAGVVVEVQPVGRRELPGWIERRLARQGQSASRPVLELLADRVEGHLLAAHQEIEKLALLLPPGELSAEAVHEAVASVARYGADAVAEALLAGDLARYVRSLAGLRAEGDSPSPLVWTLAGALAAAAGIAAGRPAESELRQHRVWSKPLQRAAQAAARRFGAQPLEAALLRCARIDRAVKGVAAGEPWEQLLALGLELAGGSKG